MPVYAQSPPPAEEPIEIRIVTTGTGTVYEAVMPDGSIVEVAEEYVTMRWSYINSIANNLTISGGSASISVTVRASTDIGKITVYSVLYKQSGSTWVSQSPTYSDTFWTNYGHMSRTKTECSGSYKLVTTVRVFDKNNTAIELESDTVTTYS